MSSDFARRWAAEFAQLASEGLITTWTGIEYGRKWRPTALGLDHLENT